MTKYFKYHEAAPLIFNRQTKQLGVSRTLVVKLVNRGDLGTKHADGRYSITQRDIDDFNAIPRKPGRPSLAGPEKG
jgi:hypothetical protein